MTVINKVEVENYLLTAIDPSFDTQFNLWVLAMEEYINSMANRVVIGEDAEAEYTYSGNGSSTIFLDDFRTISTITVDGSEIDASGYVAKPFNRGYVNQLTLNNGGRWSTYKQGNIKVTGKRGMYASSTVPQDLRFALVVLVAGIVQTSSNENKEIQSETIGRYSVSYKTDTQKVDYKNALEIIKSYRRYSI